MVNFITELSLAKRKGQRISAVDVVHITDMLVDRIGDQVATRFICRALTAEEDSEALSGRLTSIERKLLFEVSDLWRRMSCAVEHRLYHPDDIPASVSAADVEAAPKVFASEDERKLAQYEDDIRRLKKRIADVEQERQKAVAQTMASAKQLEDVQKQLEAMAEQYAVESAAADDKLKDAESKNAQLLKECQTVQSVFQNRLDEAEERHRSVMYQLDDMEKLIRAKDEVIQKFTNILPQNDLELLLEIGGDQISDVDKRIFHCFKVLMLTDGREAKKIQTRFERFDTELYEGFMDERDELDRRRQIYAPLINGKFKDREISWDLCGRQLNEDLHVPLNNAGVEVEEVISALVMSTVNGKCIRRAKVRTMDPVSADVADSELF